MRKALIFDFDGLILDTEKPIFRSWQEIFQRFGCNLSLDTWSSIIGTADTDFNPLDELERQYGRLVKREEIIQEQLKREMQLILAESVLPGVEAYLHDAKQLGLKIGLASSSTCEWVTGHLSRLGLLSYFDCLFASDDVHRTKPDPALYSAVLEYLGVRSDQAIAFEDSPHGILAARRAGVFCVAVPNELTRSLSMENANLQLNSLTELHLLSLLELIDGVSE